jgi:hypothetical protein
MERDDLISLELAPDIDVIGNAAKARKTVRQKTSAPADQKLKTPGGNRVGLRLQPRPKASRAASMLERQ